MLLCGSSTRPDVQALISRCFADCGCAAETKVIRDRFTTELKFGAGHSATGPLNMLEPPVSPYATEQMQNYDPSAASNGGVSTYSCSKKCSNINRDCHRFFKGDCKCFAPPVASLFWHTASCGLVHELRKRNLAQQRRSYYLNVTDQYTRLNKAAAPPGPPPPDLAAQLASGLLPSPCNASYVSFACSDSKDGIVHEPPQNWLGALLPENAKELPPVPEEFLRIHHGKEGKMQPLRPAED
ncbi:hypothetical protein MMC22_003701 [Lobaria immixta]|nr:hypothetical protein [Lobaria immixta]